MEGWMIALGLVWPTLAGGALASGAYFARRYLMVLEQRAAGAAELADLHRRLGEVEADAEATRQAVERLEAAQEFTTKLLAARVAPGRAE